MNKEMFESLKQGMKEASAFKAGQLKLQPTRITVDVPDVKKIRSKTGLTQAEFAHLFGWSKDAVASWEQGRRIPEHAAKAMLVLIEKNPAYVLETLSA
tara:strand:- start:932 stop:1225 length:294 start_codon:yes stop_codon:yes gene_type:complete